jgi:hypothetical protein
MNRLFVKEQEMRVSKAADTDIEAVGSMREGVLEQKHLLFGEDGSPNNYDLNMGHTGGGGWRTPRHRHNFDQIRYVIQGRLPYTENDVLEEGWVGYFPESVHYGPQERAEGLRTMVLQSGGASGAGYLSVAQREATNAELEKTGEFKKGMYHYTDENGEPQAVDGSLAIFEHAMGNKLEFATPRYEDVIAMNPEAYDWLPQGDAGVSEKWLGSFTDPASAPERHKSRARHQLANPNAVSVSMARDRAALPQQIRETAPKFHPRSASSRISHRTVGWKM